MRKFIVFTLVFVLCVFGVSCGTTAKLIPQGLIASATPPASANFIVALQDRDYNIGHGCPISDQILITAAHMMERRDSSQQRIEYLHLTWGDLLGHRGFLDPIGGDRYQDVGMMRSQEKFPGFLVLAKTEPVVGETIWLVGFDRDTVPMFLKTKVISAKVTGNRAFYLFYDNTLGPGTSGSCVLNAQGELVGINVAGRDDPKIGAAVIITAVTHPGLVNHE